MRKILVFAISAFILTTGFTCSKNPPAPQAAPEAETQQPAQEQMAAPADNATTPAPAPGEGATTPTAPAPETGKEAAPETK